MKTCKYCGKENGNEAEDCSECRTPFSGENEASTRPIGEMVDDLAEFASLVRKFLRLPVPAPVRWVLWLLGWGAVIWSTIQHDPEDLRSCIGFPVGFYGLLPAEMSIYFSMLGGWAAVIIGWALYTVMSFRDC